MEIRTAELKDYAQIMALYRQLQPDDPVVDESKGKPLFKAIIESENHILIVAEVKNTVISSCYLNVIPNLSRDTKPYALIENVITDVSHRNRGIGKSVIKYALEKAWEKGCYKVMLLTGRRETSTLRFYEACGFESGIKTAFIAKHP